MVGVIDLIAILNTTKDSIGQVIPVTTETNLICDVSSISMSEFMSAGQIGLKPALRFLIWDTEYNDEQEVRYNGQLYSVYRTFLRDDGRVELYTEKRTGDV